MSCSGEKACPFPVVAGGLCRHHARFFAFPISMTDSSLDCSDFLPSDSRPVPALSVVRGAGEHRLKWEPPAARCQGKRFGNYAGWPEEAYAENRRIQAERRAVLERMSALYPDASLRQLLASVRGELGPGCQ